MANLFSRHPRRSLVGALGILALMLAIGLSPALASVVAVGGAGSILDTATAAARAKSKKKQRGKAKKGRGKTRGKAVGDNAAAEPAAKPEPAPAPAAAPAETPAVLDLSTAGSDTESARQELLQQSTAESQDKKPAGPVRQAGGGFDFGGGAAATGGGEGEFDFGGELSAFDLAAVDVNSPEHQRFDAAMGMMSSESYAEAAAEFRFFLDDPKFAEFVQESQYQLAKALYKLGFYDAALTRFQAILEQGPSHRRYRKAVEWLFFVSRKMADDTPVLAELARFRNVTWPKAYRNEYRYLLAKYLFVQAGRFEVERLEAEQLERSKKSKAATFDFGSVATAVESGGALDFSSAGADMGFDFGGDSGAAGGGGGFDFGGGDAGGGDAGGGFDFGAGAAPAGDLDQPLGPVREEAPANAREAIRQGLEIVREIEKDSAFYAKAKYLEGLLNYVDQSDQESVNAFQEVVRVLNPREGAQLDPKLREQSFLSLARIHYGHKQFNRSVYYYDLIDRDSENWLTALFEASWAYYRRGDFDKALGNLLTLHSPFFEREYFPESQLVKAIIYFEACRYSETRGIVDDFIARFTRVMTEIEKLAGSKEAPERLYDRIEELEDLAQEQTGDDVTARVVSLALADSEIRRKREVVAQTKEQLDLLASMPDAIKQSRLTQEMGEQLREQLANRIRDAGETTRKKFERELYELRSLLAQALRVKIEVARSEREVLERRLSGGEGDEVIPAQARTVVDDEHLYWPYEGEYWRDELGTYELDFSMCRPLAAR